MKSTPTPVSGKPSASDTNEIFLLHATSPLNAPMKNFVSGRIVRGSLRINDKVDIVTADRLRNSHCRCTLKKVGANYVVVDECQAPDDAALALSGLEAAEIDSQMLIATPGTLSFYDGCQVSLTNHMPTPIATGAALTCTFYWDTSSRMTLPAGITHLLPGETLDNVTIVFARPSVIELGQTFDTHGLYVCTGVVTGYGTISKPVNAVE